MTTLFAEAWLQPSGATIYFRSFFYLNLLTPNLIFPQKKEICVCSLICCFDIVHLLGSQGGWGCWTRGKGTVRSPLKRKMVSNGVRKGKICKTFGCLFFTQCIAMVCSYHYLSLKINMIKKACKPRGYPSSQTTTHRPSDQLTGVKCRATSVVKNLGNLRGGRLHLLHWAALFHAVIVFIHPDVVLFHLDIVLFHADVVLFHPKVVLFHADGSRYWIMASMDWGRRGLQEERW